ncbi:MAG: HDOD domain-containing protein [Desulfobacter sp.]|nr:MAG: HDOD domain-containing protein [Desulfobacter sp.]
MGDTDSSHAGMDLDTICIDELMTKKGGLTAKKEPAPEEAGEVIRADPDDCKVFLNDIYKKMKGRDAFLTFSSQINNVNQILTMTYSSAGDIAKVILKDMALTAQVLKLVNSSFYRQFSKKGIATISEAMIILGTDEVRQVAAGLKVFEMMKDLANSEILKEKTLKGLQRSIVARQIAWERGNRTSDALQISAMVYELGEYLVALLDPDLYIRVALAVEENRISKDEAAKGICGLTYSDLGRVMALKLNLPKDVVDAMRPVKQVPGKATKLSQKEETRYLCAYIHELCNISQEEDGSDSIEEAGALTDKYRFAVGIDMRTALGLVRMSREKVTRHAELLGIDPVVKKKTVDMSAGVKNKEALDIGIDQVEQALRENLSIHEIFTRLIETMDKCFYFNQVVISIKKKVNNTMEPRFLRGEKRPRSFKEALGFKIDRTPDIFNNAIGRRTDLVIRDIVREAYKQQIPDWYVKGIATPLQIKGFAVFPVFVDNKIVSMVYVDWNDKAPALTPNIIDYIRMFRKQMIKTFTMHSN